MPSYTIFGVKVDGEQTSPQYANAQSIENIIRSLQDNKLVKSIVIRKNWV